MSETQSEAIATCEVIEHAVTILENDRQTFSRFLDGVTKSDAVMRTHFPSAVARWHSQSVLSGLRRLGDRDNRSISLYQLFERMVAHPEDWTFDALLVLWSGLGHRYEPEMLGFLAHSTYERFADESGRALNLKRVEADRDELGTILNSARRIVNKTIAHADRGTYSDLRMTWNELDDTIFAIEDLAKRYIALLTGRGYSSERGSMTPIEQTAWYRIFDTWRDLDSSSFRPKKPDSSEESREDL